MESVIVDGRKIIKGSYTVCLLGYTTTRLFLRLKLDKESTEQRFNLKIIVIKASKINQTESNILTTKNIYKKILENYDPMK